MPPRDCSPSHLPKLGLCRLQLRLPLSPRKLSVAWSVAPSEAPSVAPSIVPSIAPSSSPWKKASVAWPVAPSEAPSVAPSIVPSIAPSSSPWKKPLPPSRPESIAPSIPPSKSHSPKGGSKAGSAVGVGGSPIGGEGMGGAGETETPITPIPSTTIPTTTVLARTARSNDPVDRSPPPTFSQIYPDYPNGPLDRLGTGIQGLRDINTNTTNPWTGADTKEKQEEKKEEGEALGSPAGQDPNNGNEPTTMTKITSTTPPALSTPLGDTKAEPEGTHEVEEKEKEKEVEADEKEKVEVDAGVVDEKPKVEEEQTEKVEANAEESNPNPDQDLDLDTSDIDSQSPLLPPEPTPADHLFVSLNIFKQIDQLKKAKIKAKRDRTKRAKKGEAVDEAASKEEDEGYDKELRRLERRAERVAYKGM
ncbi:hypothetical protein BDP27DRAFT_465149 [Rhodocollybia butyracea]|uniref:Uncharacterized protein n=1 Tax=Rhodocollybia butyracea TaxID=206335 RepID=A0A9P5P7A9_9AGAR|nr:hypothetical protein BDP27DRAFT_465149 [Rhodocollybia butyracea]